MPPPMQSPIPTPSFLAAVTPPGAPVSPKIGLHPAPEDANPEKPNAVPPGSQIEIKLKLSPPEAEQAIEALHEAGLDDIAKMFQQAISPPPDAEMEASTKSLQDAMAAGEGRM